MTRERALELFDEAMNEAMKQALLGERPTPSVLVADVVLAACAEEREACAKIADDVKNKSTVTDCRITGSYIADVIRQPHGMRRICRCGCLEIVHCIVNGFPGCRNCALCPGFCAAS